MPNQRDPEKQLFSVSMKKDTLERIARACRELGITRVDFLRMSAEDLLKKLEAEKNNQSH